MCHAELNSSLIALLCLKVYFHWTELGGTKVCSPISSTPLTAYCISLSSVPPLLCSYPNKLATEVGEGEEEEEEGMEKSKGGWALWRRSRLSVGEVHGALKRLWFSTYTHTQCLSDWMLREGKRGEKTFKISERQGRALRGYRRILSPADCKDTVELPPADPDALTWHGNEDAKRPLTEGVTQPTGLPDQKICGIGSTVIFVDIM